MKISSGYSSFLKYHYKGRGLERDGIRYPVGKIRGKEMKKKTKEKRKVKGELKKDKETRKTESNKRRRGGRGKACPSYQSLRSKSTYYIPT